MIKEGFLMMKFNKRSLLMAALLVCLLLMLFSGTALASAPEDYAAVAQSSFSSTDGLTPSGDASLDASYSRIKIVPCAGNQVGGVFTTDKVSMGSNGFSLAAEVYCGAGTQADGFALVMAKNANECIPDAVGGSLGYKGMSDSIAVQYFTYSKSDIALGIDGDQNAEDDERTSVGFAVPTDGSVYMWVDYDAANTTLAVYASTTSTRPADPVTTYTIDLSSYSDYYIGVTSATGGNYQEYALAQWYYDDYYHSSSLKLDGSVLYTDTIAANGVIAQSAEDVTSTSATLRGVWGSGYDSGYTKGIEYYMAGDSENAIDLEAADDGTVDLSGLTVNTTYYYRAYVLDDLNNYSAEKSFTTLNTYTVTVTDGGHIGSDTAATAATVDDGTRVTVTAPAMEGKIFDYWEVSGTSVSTDNPYKFTVTDDVTLTAVYFDGFAGSGTEANPFQITDKDDLALLSDLVAGGYDFAGQYFIVTQNIEMQDPETMGDYFTPIGDTGSDCAFSGTFDGNGKTISGLYIDFSDYAGLFGYLNGATVTDLTVSGATVACGDGAGCIVGYADENVTVSGCTVTGSEIDGGSYAGGMIGYAYGEVSVSGCTVTDSSIYSDGYCAGGIIGFTDYYADLSDCTVTDCDICGDIYAGGIAGYLFDDSGISGCSVTGSTIGSWYDQEFDTEYYSYHAGGIIGSAGDGINITDCTVTDCQIDGDYHAGGIAGYLYSCNNIFNCSVTDTADNTISSHNTAGGIAGYFQDSTHIYNCSVSGYSIVSDYNAGGVAGNMDDENIIDYCNADSLTIYGSTFSGGIVGYADDDNTFTHCAANGCSITGDDTVGGIAGFTHYQPVISWCTVSGGSIAGPYYIGGVLGYSESCDEHAAISNCQVTCDITGTETSSTQYIGGILGYGYEHDDMLIDDCEYNGNIIGSSTYEVYAGGIVGYNEYYDGYEPGMVISNCVAYGTITASGDSYVGGIYGYSDDEYLTLTNNVAMQSSVTGVYANSLCAGCSVAPTDSYNYASGSLTLSGDGAGGIDGTEVLLIDIDSAFWTDLGFTADNGWKQTTADNVTAAAVEAHQIAQYTVTFDANGGSAVESQTAFDGDSIDLPSATRGGYAFSGWSDGSYTYAAGASYTVTQDVTLTAVWTAVSYGSSTTRYYAITASAGEGGSISPSGSVSVAAGTDAAFTITADSGYQISDVLVDGFSAGPVAAYTFEEVSAAHTIEAVFVPDWANPFEDVAADNWYYNAVRYVYEAGLMNGISQSTFEPESELTRAMLVTILYRLDSEPSVSSEDLFEDVASGNWYSDAVAWAAENGIVGGYGDGTFGPADSITREQIAVILFNYAEYKGYDLTAANDLSAFSDAGSTSSWAQTAMEWAVGNGLLSGNGDGTLDPTGTATRAEVATILMRFIETYIN